MSVINEKEQITKLYDKIKTDEILSGIIDDKLSEAAKINAEKHSTLSDKDPYSIHDVFEKYADKGEEWKDKKTPEGRNYQQAVDMSFRIRDWIENNGVFWSDSFNKAVKMSFQDAVHSKDMQFLVPKVVSSIVIEHMEPQSNLLAMYEKLRFTNGTSITFPVWSAGGSSINLYVGEEGEPNELTGNLSSFVTASTGKVGIKASITEDAQRYSIIDLYKLRLKWCGIALGRFKERLAVDNLYSAAGNNVMFDNGALGTSLFGDTNGCDIAGNRNGTLSSYDLFDVYAHALAQGSDVNTIILHPLMWRALANNSILRDQAAKNGGRLWEGPQSGSNGRSEVGNGLNKIFNPGFKTTKVGTNSIATDATTISGTISILGQPFNVITTPYAPIRKTTAALTVGSATVPANRYVGDILMIDPRDVGFLIVDQELFSREEEKLFKQFKETAFFERYGFGTANQGTGLFTLKNIVATEGYDFLAAPVTVNAASFTAPAGDPAIPTGNL